MKRLRDEFHPCSPLKKPSVPFTTAEEENFGRPQMVTEGVGRTGVNWIEGGTQRLTTNDALAYLKAIKNVFKDKIDKYDDFLEVMKDFKSQRISTAGVIARVEELFKGHKELLLGFNNFLPKGYEIRFPQGNDHPIPKRPVEYVVAINFVNKIKARFLVDEHVYKTFLDILNMYRKESKTISEVYQEVSMLFQDHHDLLEEFIHFLPDSSATLINRYTASGRSSASRERGSSLPTVPQFQLDKKDRAAHPRADRGCSTVIENDVAILSTDKISRSVHEKRDYRDSKDNLARDHDVRDDNLQNLAIKRKICKSEDTGAIQGRDCIDDNLIKHSAKRIKGSLDHEHALCDRLKEKLCNPESYREFFKGVQRYAKETISRSELLSLVDNLLKSDEHLMVAFAEFLDCSEKDGISLAEFSTAMLSRPMKLDEKFKEMDYTGHKDGSQKMIVFSNKDKYLTKPISELDLSNCESCTPSYRRLPKNYPISIASQRTNLGGEVLNDTWVSVTSGSEDYSFKHMRKNQYEESLFRCEDDRFELDMLLESVNIATKRVEDLLEKINNNTINADAPICVEEHLTALNLRCIERLYGDHGLDVMDVLRKNTSMALPVLLTRLKQKQEEWARCRAEFNKVWADICSKNYQKSLDHRSFYFKQHDTKSLSTKALLSEIKEINEKKRKEDDALLAFSAGNRRPIFSNLEYEYPDPEIHEDLYQLIKYSSGEVCTKEQYEKVMTLWTTFLEPTLGIPPRAQNANDTYSVMLKSKLSSIGRTNEPVVKNANSNCSFRSRKPYPSRGWLIGGDRKNEPSNGYHTCSRVGGSCSTLSIDKVQVGVPEQAFDVKRGASSEELDTSSNKETRKFNVGVSDESGLNTTNSRQIDGTIDCANASSKQVAVTLTKKCVARDVSGSEREEGELSPTGDSEEDNVAVYAGGTVGKSSSVFENSHLDIENRLSHLSRSEEGICGATTVDNGNDAEDEGDESGQRSTDSENASDNGDISRSESAYGEDCSREEHEEDAYNEDNYNKAESEGDAEGSADANGVEADGGAFTFSEHFLLNVKPVAKHIPAGTREKENDNRIFYGNDSFYVLFRLHQTLYDRLQTAKASCSSAERRWRAINDSNANDLYSSFKSGLYTLLDGNSYSTKFEDDCRTIIGTQSYLLFTLDKLIYKLVKQLQAMTADELDNKLLQLYAYEQARNPRRFSDVVYRENARFLHEESAYRIECSSMPARLSIQLMDSGNDRPEVAAAVSTDSRFASYLQNDFLLVSPDKKEKRRIFLRRNKLKNVPADEGQALEGFIVLNKLECKISCSTSKVSYVLDTEDFLFRTRMRLPKDSFLSQQQRSKRVQKFHFWLSG